MTQFLFVSFAWFTMSWRCHTTLENWSPLISIKICLILYMMTWLRHTLVQVYLCIILVLAFSRSPHWQSKRCHKKNLQARLNCQIIHLANIYQYLSYVTVWMSIHISHLIFIKSTIALSIVWTISLNIILLCINS